VIVALCPAHTTTGGPEALHQLVDAVVRAGGDAAILYEPDATAAIPSVYRNYFVRTVSENDIAPTDLVVIPEIWAGQAKRFAYANTALWWLSVDNAATGALDAPVAMHLAQSQYAANHLTVNGLEPIALGDYITTSFTLGLCAREMRIAVNPAKGRDLIDSFRSKFPDLDIVSVEGLSREETIRTFQSSAVFVDFGHHPGKDRMAREASRCGAVVFVRKAGAALNNIDVPLPDEYKFDDNHRALYDAIQVVFSDFEGVRERQTTYRSLIASERRQFDADICHLRRWF
jgi:hypothetical protein